MTRQSGFLSWNDDSPREYSFKPQFEKYMLNKKQFPEKCFLNRRSCCQIRYIDIAKLNGVNVSVSLKKN